MPAWVEGAADAEEGEEVDVVEDALGVEVAGEDGETVDVGALDEDDDAGVSGVADVCPDVAGGC